MYRLIDKLFEDNNLEILQKDFLEEGIILTKSGNLKTCNVNGIVVVIHKKIEFNYGGFSINEGRACLLLEYENNNNELFIPFFDVNKDLEFRLSSDTSEEQNVRNKQLLLKINNGNYTHVCNKVLNLVGNKVKSIDHRLFSKNKAYFVVQLYEQL